MDEATKHRKIITTLSIILPIVVAALFSVKINIHLPIFLPPIYATINAITALVLIIALWAIKNKKQKLHENLMKLAILLSISFLILYITYHISSNPTRYLGTGWLKYTYFFILISHILLSIIVIPLVLISFSRALLKNFRHHKKIARMAYPIWLYVAVSGVLVYILISPYYIR